MLTPTPTTPTPPPPKNKTSNSGNILIRRDDSAGEDASGLDVALADLGLACAWSPLRAALDMRAIGAFGFGLVGLGLEWLEWLDWSVGH
jgi:hypothetical protein